MDRFDSVQLGSSNADVCGKCGMHTEDSDGCCHDEIKIVKIHDDQQSSSVSYSFNSFLAIATLPGVFVNDIIQKQLPASMIRNHSPPLPDDDICLLNCVFRI